MAIACLGVLFVGIVATGVWWANRATDGRQAKKTVPPPPPGDLGNKPTTDGGATGEKKPIVPPKKPDPQIDQRASIAGNWEHIRGDGLRELWTITSEAGRWSVQGVYLENDKGVDGFHGEDCDYAGGTLRFRMLYQRKRLTYPDSDITLELDGSRLRATWRVDGKSDDVYLVRASPPDPRYIFTGVWQQVGTAANISVVWTISFANGDWSVTCAYTKAGEPKPYGKWTGKEFSYDRGTLTLRFEKSGDGEFGRNDNMTLRLDNGGLSFVCFVEKTAAIAGSGRLERPHRPSGPLPNPAGPPAGPANPPPPVAPAPSTPNGLQVQFFEGRNFEQPRPELTRFYPNVDFTTGNRPEGLRENEISMMWTGWLLPPRAGQYEFAVNSDDGFRLWLARDLPFPPLIDHWRERLAHPAVKKSILLKREPCGIRIAFFNSQVVGILKLSWKVPGTDKEVVVPTTAFFLSRDDALAALKKAE